MTTSVVLATYNGQKYLQRQLESIALQSSKPFELIVKDDASKDATVEIARRFQQTADFEVIVIVNEKNVGFRENFMQAIGHARGEFVAFCDQDDIWHPEKLETIERRFAKNDRPCLVRHNAELIDGDNRRVGMLFAEREPEVTSPARYVPWSAPQGLTMAIRRNMLAFLDLWQYSRDDHFLHQRMGHDQYFYFLATCFGVTAFIPENLVSYRIHGSNECGTSVGLSRRLRLDSLWWALTCFRTIEKKLQGLHSRRDILLRAVDADYGIEKKYASEYIFMLDKHIDFLKTQKTIYFGTRLSERLSALSDLYKRSGYGSSEDGKIESSHRLTDMLGAALGPTLANSADKLKSAVNSHRAA